MSKTMRSNLMLLLTAAIWGLAFVPQRLATAYVPPLAFNGLRFALGALSLIPLILWQNRQWQWPPRQALIGGELAGLMIFFAAFFQQIGLISTTAGKAGFITGLYVIFVPMLGILWGSRTRLTIWGGAVLALCGLYLLSVTEIFTIDPGDLWVLIGAVFWALQIIVLEHFSQRTNALQLAFTQFSTCSILSLSASIFFEEVHLAGIMGGGLLPILYSGFISVGIAYTLQVFAQRDAHPAYAAVFLSMEGVFAAISGWLILGEVLTPRGLWGCGLILTGLILAQLTPNRLTKTPVDMTSIP